MSLMFLVTLEYPQAEMNDPLFSVPLSEVKELSADTFVIDLLRDDGVLAAHDKVQQRA